jgi:hypothetical protein
MRLPIASDIDSRDGASAKDERLTNMLGEDNNGQQMATLRPGLATIATASGAGGGAVNFNDVLISVYGTTLGFGPTPSTIGTVVAGSYDFCQSPL